MASERNIPTASNTHPDAVKPSVLIVDDDFDTCDLMCAFLSRDYNCETVFDGQDALDRMRKGEYAAILADLMMPNVDGYSILYHAAKVDPSPPVIVVTAVAGQHATAIEMGAFDYIIKPFEPERVEMSVRRAVTRYNDRRVATPGQ
jgi:DNA-binding response OmpR family regulator